MEVKMIGVCVLVIIWAINFVVSVTREESTDLAVVMINLWAVTGIIILTIGGK